MIFKTHEMNIPQIKAAVKAFGEVWVHGTGDIFPVFKFDPDRPGEQDHSKNMAEHYNKNTQDANGYRVLINQNNIPMNKEHLDNMLRRAKDQETIMKQAPNTQNGAVRNVIVQDEDVYEPVADVDYSALVRDFNNVPEAQEKSKPGRKPKV